jgi:hypothetical protein
MLKFKEITRENEIQKLVETSVASSWSLQKNVRFRSRVFEKKQKNL